MATLCVRNSSSESLQESVAELLRMLRRRCRKYDTQPELHEQSDIGRVDRALPTHNRANALQHVPAQPFDHQSTLLLNQKAASRAVELCTRSPQFDRMPH